MANKLKKEKYGFFFLVVSSFSACREKAYDFYTLPERYEEQQDCFLVHVPTPQETRHGAQHDALDKVRVRRRAPQFREVQRDERDRRDERRQGRDVGQDSKRGLTYQPSRRTRERGRVDRDSTRDEICFFTFWGGKSEDFFFVRSGILSLSVEER